MSYNFCTEVDPVIKIISQMLISELRFEGQTSSTGHLCLLPTMPCEWCDLC